MSLGLVFSFDPSFRALRELCPKNGLVQSALWSKVLIYIHKSNVLSCMPFRMAITNRTKNAIYSLLLLAAVMAVWTWRSRNEKKMIKVTGSTMATTYTITYYDPMHRDFTTSIDSILALVNKSINTYDPESEVSIFNKSSTGVAFRLPYLRPPLEVARQVNEASGGAFDPTVMPLVNAWGFGPKKGAKPDSVKVDSLRTLIGMGKVFLTKDSVRKTDPRVQLDFGGIGQGYGADVVANFLRSKGVENMFVELGGEGVALGVNTESGKPWLIGIVDPTDVKKARAYMSLSNRAYTTSGNYYNYFEVNGQRFGHSIDPTTGYPAQRAVLSASVFAPDCTTADAWATSIMVMGHEKAIEVLKGHPELDAFLVYSVPGGTATYTTPGIAKVIEVIP